MFLIPDKLNSRIKRLSFALFGGVGGANAAPIASNVDISGTLSFGETLTGTYDYFDPNGNPEMGSTYQWYRADDASGTNAAAIGGATALTYETVLADDAKYLRFGVVPSDGTLQGAEAFSGWEGPIAYPDITLISTSSADSAGAGVTSLVINKPANVQEGDLLVMSMQSTTDPNVNMAPPAGWTTLNSNTSKEHYAFTAPAQGLFWKIATGAEPANYTFNFTDSEIASLHMHCWRYAKIGLLGIRSANQTTCIAPTVKVPANKCVALALYGQGGANGTFSTPTGMTPLVSKTNATAPTNATFYQANISAGEIGNKTSTLNSAGRGQQAFLIPGNVTPSVPTLVSSEFARNSNTGVISVTVNKPAGVQQGDLLLAFVGCSSGETWTPDQSWTTLRTQPGGVAPSMVAYSRVAGSSEPSTYTFSTGTTTDRPMAAIVACRNAAVDASEISILTPGNAATNLLLGESYVFWVTATMSDGAASDIPRSSTAKQAQDQKSVGIAPSILVEHFDYPTYGYEASGNFDDPTFVTQGGVNGITTIVSIKHA